MKEEEMEKSLAKFLFHFGIVKALPFFIQECSLK
jgi:hypothetical protein